MNISTMTSMTDQQWKKYQKAHVTIPLEMLDDLITGAQLLSQGKRIDPIYRSNWENLRMRAQAHYDASLNKIVNS